jgi:hypothetical protein
VGHRLRDPRLRPRPRAAVYHLEITAASAA